MYKCVRGECPCIDNALIMYKCVRGECPCIDNALIMYKCTIMLEVNVLVLIMHYYVQMR